MSTTVSVFGATGAQGGSVAKALLKDGRYKVRAFSRNPDSDASKELVKLGATIVKLDDTDSKEAIKNALAGSQAVFCVTNWWAYYDKELQIGLNIADAAFETGTVKHFVYSSLAGCKEISGGKIEVAHFDLKNKIEQHLKSLSAKNPSFVTSFVYAAFYMQNFFTFFPPKKNDDGSFTLTMPVDPSSKFPLDLVDISELGSVVAQIFASPDKFSGKVIPVAGDTLTGAQIAEKMSKASGKKVVYNYVPTDVFGGFGFPGAKELAAMFEYYNIYGAFHTHDKTVAQKLVKLSTFDEFLTKSKFKLE